ncbi:MAG TPA: GNAT family protein [Bryobacteraceae bacterium]|nr:GNAT family protein [Bryobacteraceae bacterium]
MTFRRVIGDGIEIRQFELADAGAVFASVERNREYLREWLPWVDATHSPDDVRRFISRSLEQFRNNQGPSAGIWLDGALNGSVGCHPIDWADRCCSIGYWLDPAHRGKGVVTRCCASLLDYLFNGVGVHRVEIRCGTGNTASCAIPARLGFTREGILYEAQWVPDRWVDLVVWGMLKQNWKGRK